MAVADIRNFRSIDDRLGTAGQPTEAQLADVAAAGYAVVVNLGLLDPKYCLPDEAGAVASLGMAYRHIPVKFDAPTVEDFRAFVTAMDAWSDRKVFVHCAANFRVSAFVAVYAELRLGWTRGCAVQTTGVIRLSRGATGEGVLCSTTNATEPRVVPMRWATRW